MINCFAWNTAQFDSMLAQSTVYGIISINNLFNSSLFKDAPTSYGVRIAIIINTTDTPISGYLIIESKRKALCMLIVPGLFLDHYIEKDQL